MSWQYWLLRIPMNEEEFLTSARKKGIRRLEILINECVIGNEKHEVYECFPIFAAGEGKFIAKSFLRRSPLAPKKQDINLVRPKVLNEVFNQIFLAARVYQQSGFNITVLGRPIEEEEKTKEHYSKQGVIYL